MALISLTEQAQFSFEPSHMPQTPPNGAGVAHNPNRQAAWRASLERSFAYYHDRASSDGERAQLEALYERELTHGPDFTRHHSTADFSPAPRITADRNELARIRFQFRLLVDRQTDADRDAARREGKRKFSRTFAFTVERVLDFLANMAAKHRHVFPCLDSIAAATRLDRKTVQAAIRTLELFGFLTVVRRIKRIRTALGFKVVQDSNAYNIQLPTSGLGAIALRAFNLWSEGKNCQALKPDLKSETPKPCEPPPPASDPVSKALESLARSLGYQNGITPSRA